MSTQVSNRSAIEPGKLRDLPVLRLNALGGTKSVNNFHHLMRGLSITQSIYVPYVQTRLTVLDGAGLNETYLPILGEEELEFSITDSGGRTLNGSSYMYTLSEQIPYQNHRSLSYIMQGASSWYHNNLRDKVRKTFHDMSYTDMAAAIASEYLGKPFDSVHGSEDMQKDYFCPCLSPVQLIELMAKRAMQGNRPAFYRLYAKQTSGGGEELMFHNIDVLTSEGPKWTFFYGEPVDEAREAERRQVSGMNQSRVISMQRANNNNTHDLTLAGYASRGYDQLDIYRRNVIQESYNFGRTSNLASEELQTNSFVKRHMESRITPHVRNRFQVYDDTEQYRHRALDKHLFSQPLINSLTQRDIVIESHGNFQVGVGDVVQYEEPRIDGYNERERSERYSGKYLITSKTDTISRDGTHISKFVLSRESDGYDTFAGLL